MKQFIVLYYHTILRNGEEQSEWVCATWDPKPVKAESMDALAKGLSAGTYRIFEVSDQQEIHVSERTVKEMQVLPLTP